MGLAPRSPRLSRGLGQQQLQTSALKMATATTLTTTATCRVTVAVYTLLPSSPPLAPSYSSPTRREVRKSPIIGHSRSRQVGAKRNANKMTKLKREFINECDKADILPCRRLISSRNTINTIYWLYHVHCTYSN